MPAISDDICIGYEDDVPIFVSRESDQGQRHIAAIAARDEAQALDLAKQLYWADTKHRQTTLPTAQRLNLDDADLEAFWENNASSPLTGDAFASRWKTLAIVALAHKS